MFRWDGNDTSTVYVRVLYHFLMKNSTTVLPGRTSCLYEEVVRSDGTLTTVTYSSGSDAANWAKKTM